jgi:hypothetical protein
MRRIALTALFFAALAAPAHAAAPAKVVLTTCSPDDRAAGFQARMGKVDGATRLKMKFTLQARHTGQKAYHGVAAPGFRAWSAAAPGKTSWVFTRRVEALIGPARYRAVVRFQWIDADGKVLARAKKTSRSCFQPDHRPNLKIKSIAHTARHRYTALVVNNGRTAAGAFDVQLAIGDTLLDPVGVEGLEPHAQQVVTFHGPVCNVGTPLTATADPLNVVDERNELDNALTTTCG